MKKSYNEQILHKATMMTLHNIYFQTVWWRNFFIKAGW